MTDNLIKISFYSLFFALITAPLTIRFGFSVNEIIALSVTLGFFAGILHEITSELKSINNQLRNR
jgi:hypothetical protein